MTAAKNFDLEHYIMHHVRNSNEWQLPFLAPIKLPPFISLHGFMMILGSLFLIYLFCFCYKRNQRFPRGINNFLEIFVIFIRDEISIACLGKEDGLRMTPLFCTFFFFILGLNLMGLIPLFSSPTANVNVTGALAFITLSLMILGAIYKNGFIGFLKAFVPEGVPFPILFFLVPIEFIGMFIKAFALMIRLFANMFAGHIVILCLLGLVALLGAVALPTVILAVFMFLLEIFVAFLQAYIFTLLSALFMGQMYHPQH